MSRLISNAWHATINAQPAYRPPQTASHAQLDLIERQHQRALALLNITKTERQPVWPATIHADPVHRQLNVIAVILAL